MRKTSVKDIRESQLLSKTELAKMADLSPLTINRIENGYPCRIQTKRKLLVALVVNLKEPPNVFGHNG